MICPWCNNQMCFIQYSYDELTSTCKVKYITYYSHYYCSYCGYQESTLPGPINTMQKIVEENEEEEIITGVYHDEIYNKCIWNLDINYVIPYWDVL